jgi:hypothetical protein
MSPEEVRGHPAIAGNRASREIKSPPAVAETAAAVAMQIAAVVVEMVEVAPTAAGAQIAAAGKRADEEFR